VAGSSENGEPRDVKSPKTPPVGTSNPPTSFDPDVAQAIGATLRRHREAAGVAQDVLPILAQVDRGFYGKLERGQGQPTVSMLLRIAKALGTTGSELLAEAEAQLPPDWRSDVEVGAVKSEALTKAMQRAAVRRAAAAKRVVERKGATARLASAPAPGRPASKKLTMGEKQAGRPIRKRT
jgi:transcriptional regulator with XRE-family HTH domain